MTCQLCSVFIFDTLLNHTLFIQHNYASILNKPNYCSWMHQLTNYLVEAVFLYPNHLEQTIQEVTINNLINIKAVHAPNSSQSLEEFKQSNMNLFFDLQYKILEHFVPQLRGIEETVRIEAIEKRLLRRPGNLRTNQDLQYLYRSWYLFMFFTLKSEVNEIHALHSRSRSVPILDNDTPIDLH